MTNISEAAVKDNDTRASLKLENARLLSALTASEAALAEARGQVAVLREAAQAWCDAVERDSSWDGWDHHYRAMKYRILPATADLAARRDQDMQVKGMLEAAEIALDQQGRRMMGAGQLNSAYDVGISDACAAIRAAAKRKGEG